MVVTTEKGSYAVDNNGMTADGKHFGMKVLEDHFGQESTAEDESPGAFLARMISEGKFGERS